MSTGAAVATARAEWLALDVADEAAAIDAWLASSAH